MTEHSTLVPIHQTPIDGDNIDTVNARDLHNFLEVGRFFTQWIKNRIEKYGFTEGVDFVVETFFAKSGKNSGRGRPSHEYFISLDMAKELSMVENNEKGRQARRYFIECEKAVKSQPKPAPQTLSPQLAAIQGLLDHAAQVEARVSTLEEKVKEFDSDTGYMSAAAFARVYNISLPTSEARRLGRRAGVLCRARCQRIGQVPDERWGRVNSYPVETLWEALGDLSGLEGEA